MHEVCRQCSLAVLRVRFRLLHLVNVSMSSPWRGGSILGLRMQDLASTKTLRLETLSADSYSCISFGVKNR